MRLLNETKHAILIGAYEPYLISDKDDHITYIYQFQVVFLHVIEDDPVQLSANKESTISQFRIQNQLHATFLFSP